MNTPPAARVARRLLAVSIAGIACFALLGSAVAWAGAIVSNGTVALGVNDTGELNFRDPATRVVRGVTFLPTGLDGLAGGCLCEGWGAANADPADTFFGKANREQPPVAPAGPTVRPVSFTATASTAVSVTRIADKLQVTHEFRPFAGSRNLYEVAVTLQNIGAAPLADVRYTRLMDWDIAPTPFSEFVTIGRGHTPELLHSDDNGFADNNPLAPRDLSLSCPECDPRSVDADITDSGPVDHGALFDFGFGALAAGQSRSFSLFYGATRNEADADAAVAASGAPVFSYGQPSTSAGARSGEPTTFVFAFNPSGPTVGRTVVARVVSGEVLVRPPGPPSGLAELHGAAVLPVGSVIDARRGRLALTSV
ncbi:MAG: hypothetical protein M3296_07500, partial [Actinomycetota bacterium]|nr:hypothetical protein [Actinomycetota bacterium]